MTTLNVGCGSDSWGDIRVDLMKTWRLRPTWPNIICDAHYLPFKTQAFQRVRVWHVIEHLQRPLLALQEWSRVSAGIIHLRFPVRSGMILQFFREATGFRIRNLADLNLPARRRSHLWQIDDVSLLVQQVPFARYVHRPLYYPFLGFLDYGRKAAFLVQHRILVGVFEHDLIIWTGWAER